MEGVSVDGAMYVYHTTDHSEQRTMGRSVVARSLDSGHSFTHLYNVSSEKFINVSLVETAADDWDQLPAEAGSVHLLFGSGEYRSSEVYLASQPASGIENPGTIRYFAGLDDADEPLWDKNEANAQPLFSLENPCVGELSVSYNSHIGRWILLYNCSGPRGINLRTAKFPWGPWTESQVIFHPWEDNGYCNFIHTSWENQQCDNVHDPGRENEWGGEYGPYQFESLATGSEQSTRIYFTMSTWNPYTVVLMQAALALK